MTEYIPHRRCELPILVVHTLGLEEKGRTAVQHLPVEMVFWYHSFQWKTVHCFQLQTLHWLRTSISNEGIRYDRASIKRKLCTEGASKSKRWPRECIQIKEFALGVYPNHVVAPGNTLKSRQEVSPGYDPPSARHFSVL